MERLNLTLDDDTSTRLEAHAKKQGRARAALARELIREALTQRDTRELRRKLASDYAAGRDDAAEVLQDLERAQFDLLDEP